MEWRREIANPRVRGRAARRLLHGPWSDRGDAHRDRGVGICDDERPHRLRVRRNDRRGGTGPAPARVRRHAGGVRAHRGCAVGTEPRRSPSPTRLRSRDLCAGTPATALLRPGLRGCRRGRRPARGRAGAGVRDRGASGVGGGRGCVSGVGVAHDRRPRVAVVDAYVAAHPASGAARWRRSRARSLCDCASRVVTEQSSARRGAVSSAAWSRARLAERVVRPRYPRRTRHARVARGVRRGVSRCHVRAAPPPTLWIMTSIASRPVSVDPASVELEVLPNGLTVLVRRDDAAPVVAIVTHVKAGYFDETDDLVGIAHVLEHMYFKGTPSRGVGAIAKETKASGGYLNASTIYDHTVYYTVLPSSGLVAGLEIQADAYANSVIDADELARELEVIIQEAKRKSDNPSAVTTETLFELLHDQHRMRRWRIGREAGLRRLTRDDLVRFYRNFYRPSTTILSIVGDIDVAETMRHVERLYGALEAAPIVRVPGPEESGPERFRYREMSGDIAQSELVLGWRTQPTLHQDTPILDLAAGALGSGRASRLYRAVRERQLA